jgi:hypothetical protein
MDVNYNTVGSFVKENYNKVGLRICPSDSHPSGACPKPQFEISNPKHQISGFQVSGVREKKQRIQ